MGWKLVASLLDSEARRREYRDENAGVQRWAADQFADIGEENNRRASRRQAAANANRVNREVANSVARLEELINQQIGEKRLAEERRDAEATRRWEASPEGKAKLEERRLRYEARAEADRKEALRLEAEKERDLYERMDRNRRNAPTAKEREEEHRRIEEYQTKVLAEHKLRALKAAQEKARFAALPSKDKVFEKSTAPKKETAPKKQTPRWKSSAVVFGLSLVATVIFGGSDETVGWMILALLVAIVSGVILIAALLQLAYRKLAGHPVDDSIVSKTS